MNKPDENTKIEEELRQTNRLFELVIETTGCGIWDRNLVTGKVEWSPELFTLYDLNPNSVKPSFELWQNTVHPEDQSRLNQEIETSIKLNNTFNVDYRIACQNGDIRWINTIGKISVDACMQPEHMTGICIDITERKKTEAAHATGEIRFKNTLDSLIEGCMIIGFDWTYLYLNNTAALHGQNTRENMIGQNMLKMYYGIEKTPIFARYKQCMEQRIPQRFEEAFTFANGKTAWHLFSVEPIPEGIFVLSQDITASKQLESVQNIHEHIINSSRDGFWLSDMNGNCLKANQAYADMVGYPIDTLVNMNVTEIDVVHDKQKVQARIDKIIAQGQDLFETQQRHKDGHLIDVEVSSQFMADQQMFVAFFRDITNRKQVENMLFCHSQILRSVATGIILIRVIDKRIVYTNPKFEKMYDYLPGELIGEHVSVINANTDRSPEETTNEINRHLAQGDYWSGEILNITQDGTPFWCQVDATKMQHPEFGPTWLETHTDISERKKVQLELESSLAFSKQLIASLHSGVLILDHHGCILDVNASLCTMYGLDREELIGKHAPYPYWPPEEYKNIQAFFEKALVGEVTIFETTHMRKNGERFPVLVCPAIIRNTKGDIMNYITTIKDISELKAAELAKQNTKKSFNRETLVREVHHRIKNNLQGITGILRGKAFAFPALSETIQLIIGQINSVAVIHGLQGKTGQSEIRLCDLSTAIAVECEKLWHAKITVDKPDKWVPFIVHESESVPLALVLHELITNAVKHSHDKIVSIKFSSPSAYNVILTIENAGSIPHDFGIHNSEKFGTGLQLVASLLPPEGVKLYWEQQGGIVTTLVKVYAPVVQSEAME